MNSEWFEEVVKNQIKMCEDVLINKAKEYSDDYDRLHNFKNAAGMMSCDAKEALSGMMAKHTISVYDMCRSGKDYPIELWNEKITDHINYLLLLKAIVTEEKYADMIKPIHENPAITSLPVTEFIEKIQKDPHVKYEPVPGMTLMGNTFNTDEKPQEDIADYTEDDIIDYTEKVIQSLKICVGNDCVGCMYHHDFDADCAGDLRLRAAKLLESARNQGYPKKKEQEVPHDNT